MDITIYTSILKERIEEEVSHVADATYGEGGVSLYDSIVLTEKDQNIVSNAISEAAARLSDLCIRFLENDYEPFGDNETSVPEGYLYSFAISERRALGKKEPLTEAMSSFMIDYVLSDIYSRRGLSELSARYGQMAADAGSRINQMLFTKLPPRV